MRILVTGAAGQVGSDLLPLLLAQGHSVTGFDLAPRPAGVPDGVVWTVGDVTIEAEVNDAVKAAAPDVVYHLAAVLSATGERAPFRAWRVNMDGTRHVLEAARLFEARQVVFASTIAAFGPGLPDPTPNDVSMRPTTMYGLTKVAGELLGEYYASRYGLDFRGVRFPGLVSAVEPGGGTSDYVNWMYFDGVRKGAYEAFVRADTRIPLMYMPDALRALIDLADAPATRLAHRVYNVAAMSPRADEIAAAVTSRVRGARITFRSDPRRQAIADSWPRALDDSAARAEWGWAPRYGLDTMSDELLAAIRGESAKAGVALGSSPSEPRPTVSAKANATKPRGAKSPAKRSPANRPAAVRSSGSPRRR